MDPGLLASLGPGMTERSAPIYPVAPAANLQQHAPRQETKWRSSMSLNRRTVLQGALATGVATSALKVPAAVAQAGPIKVGFLTIKTGPLASGGLQMEQGLVTFFKEKGNKMAGRAVELHTQDTAGNPAQARTKTQELVERLNVHCIIGPLAAFEALAIDDYIRPSKTPNLDGFTPIDESLLQRIGENGLGAITGCWYSGQIDNAINKRFVAEIQKEYKVDPGVYAAETYVCGEVLNHAVEAIKGKVEDKDALNKALHEAKLPDSLRGPLSFDEFGNVVGNIYIRKVEKKDGKYVNAIIKTYPNVSQFWTYNKDAFLQEPVFSGAYPPAKDVDW